MFELVANPDTNWMQCTTCKRTAIANPTGVCLRCQKGFVDGVCEDDYIFHKKMIELKERKDAIEERLEQSDDSEEHQDRNEGWKATETSYRNRPPNCS